MEQPSQIFMGNEELIHEIFKPKSYKLDRKIPLELSPCPECKEKDYHKENCTMFNPP